MSLHYFNLILTGQCRPTVGQGATVHTCTIETIRSLRYFFPITQAQAYVLTTLHTVGLSVLATLGASLRRLYYNTIRAKLMHPAQQTVAQPEFFLVGVLNYHVTYMIAIFKNCRTLLIPDYCNFCTMWLLLASSKFFYRPIVISFWFLADRTHGRAIGTLTVVSVVCLSVT